MITMGILHYSDRQKGIVFVVWDGQVTWAHWYEHMRTLLAHPDWPVISRFIVDLRSVTDTSSIRDKEIDQVKIAFTSDQPALAGKRSAIIASREFRRASRFAELVERFGTSTVVFNNLDTACLFLGIDFMEAHKTLEGLRLKLRNASSL
jgi:hypothetical protein